MQIGYKCKECKTEIRNTDSDIYSEIYSLIRRDYNKYWSTYQRKISEMTKGEAYGIQNRIEIDHSFKFRNK